MHQKSQFLNSQFLSVLHLSSCFHMFSMFFSWISHGFSMTLVYFHDFRCFLRQSSAPGVLQDVLLRPRFASEERQAASQWSWWEDTTHHMDILGIDTVWMVINQTTHHYPMIEISFVKYCSAKQTWIIVCFPSVNYYRPCQIGVGRLISTKNELFSGLSFICDNLPEGNILANKKCRCR